MRAHDVKATCPTCGATPGISEVSEPRDDTAVRVKVHPFVKRWIETPHHEVADERQVHLKGPILPVPDSDLKWATHRHGYIVVYLQLQRDRQIEFIRIEEGGWQESFLDR